MSGLGPQIIFAVETEISDTIYAFHVHYGCHQNQLRRWYQFGHSGCGHAEGMLQKFRGVAAAGWT
jgi:hypothetical protein